MSAVSWRMINFACIVAATIQLGFILKSFLKPTLLNTSVEEIDLQDIDFPIEIKICAQPGFNQTVLKKMGYGKAGDYEEGIWNYFLGRSQFNSSIIGWAGHTKDFGVKGSVEEVFNKLRNHKIEDIINSSRVQMNSGRYQNLSLKHFHLADRVNYPHNCFNLNLTFLNEIHDERINTLEIFFNSTKAEKIQLAFYGSSLAANREIYDDTFDTTGDAIIIEKPGLRKYAVEISGNSYLEEDKSKKCRNYPNAEYASYKECDEKYMRNICDKVGLVPVWISENFSEVTTKAVIADTGYNVDTGLGKPYKKRVHLGQMTQITVCGVGWSQTCINRCLWHI